MASASKKPDFAGAYSKANEILVKSSVIVTFPYAPKVLVKEQIGIPCRSYAKARKHGANIEYLGSESAILVEYMGRRILFYDDTKPDTHIRFSILHELGHAVMGHDLSIKLTNTELYARYEVETNYFSAQLLMPEQIIRELQRRGIRITKQFLMEHFFVSGQAAEKRIETLAKTNDEWRQREEREFDDIILMKYANFLNKICPADKFLDFESEYARQQERNTWY